MKKLFTIIISAMLFAVAAFAEDVVYLNNGNVVKGTVTKEDALYVEVQTASGSVVQYKKIDVRKIEKGSAVVTPKEPKRAKFVDYDYQKTGWWCAVEVMGGGSVDVNYNPHLYNIGFSFINGYRINQYIRVGIGVGFRYYAQDGHKPSKSNFTEDSWFDFVQDNYQIFEPKQKDFQAKYMDDNKDYNGTPWSIPLFIDIRGNFISNDTRMCVPYWSLDLGYSFSNKYLKDYKVRANGRGEDFIYDFENAKAVQGDGFFFAPTFGVKLGGPRHTFLIGLTYMGQILPRFKTSGTLNQLPEATITGRYTSFMCGKIAYEF